MLSMLRTRLLATALVPVLVVVIAIVAVFLTVRIDDLEVAQRERGRLILRQLATASQYGLFSGNQSSLNAVVLAVVNEVDVVGAAVFDNTGALVASAGAWSPNGYAEAAYWRDQGLETLRQPIAPASVALENPFDEPESAPVWRPPALGDAVLLMSRESLQVGTHRLLLWALSLGLAGIVLAWLIAAGLGRRVMQPVARVSQRIARIGQGDLGADDLSGAPDPLAALQQGLNDMAQQLRQGRDALEQRVAQVTQELRLKKDEAEMATAAKSRFLAAASHDLRQPTHALGMLIARLGQLQMSQPAREVVRSVQQAAQATQDLLDALLDVSLFDAGAVPVDLRPVCLAELLAQVQFNLDGAAQAKGLRLRMLAGPHWVRSDPVLLLRMVMNLAHNAVRYTERGAVLVTCRAVDSGQQVRIDVLDSGIGISPADQSCIFQEFYQVGNAQRDRTYGLGLGLSIVERGAKLLGHGLGLRSALGCGTRFSITVPIAAAPEPAPRAASSQVGPSEGLVGVRVLVIEDDALALDATRILLQSWACQVLAAADLEQARQALLGGFVPQLLVSDYRLGGSDNGIAAIASVRAMAGFAVPACLISGDADAQLIDAASEARLALLHKPVHPEQLRQLLLRLVHES